MNFMPIVYAVLALGGLGLVFGLVLTVADKAFKVEVDERVPLIREALPGANCGACGYPGCDGLAQAIIDGKAPADACPVGGAKAAAAIAAVMGVTVADRPAMLATVLCQGETGVSKQRYDYVGYPSCAMASSMAGGPKQCPYACVGLGDCVKVCKFGALSVVDGLARVDAEKCTACGMCASICPRKSIQLLPAGHPVRVLCQNDDKGVVSRDACQKSCIGCKQCVRACEAGAITVEHFFAKIDQSKCTKCGACKEKCPRGCIII
ncbi:MAG: RnfABCDGE type electron transport complex subunit B [Oscillospiraceae bacterium]|jgi:RnfABCDGE-type electron transport complex B subunit|nr:RnfABCDGE type electron transport complex subunit B [Oscillospiraceae bacterium]